MAPRLNSRNRCPPGIFCLSPGVIVGGIVVILIIIAAAWYLKNPSPSPVILSSVSVPPMSAPQTMTNVLVDTDARYKIAPRPERLWQTEYEIPRTAYSTRIPIGIPTQGLPESYQSMGIIRTQSGQMLPLYGRRTTSRSDRFQYYTRTDSANPIPLPIHYKRRDCQDDVGCDELFNGESVKITGTGETGDVTIYRYDGPTYIPGLL